MLPQALLLLGIGLATGWGPTGWILAASAAGILDLLVVLAMRRDGAAALGPADLVTWTRATLTCAVLALVGTSLRSGELVGGSPWTLTITVIAAVALVLDLVDGRVARGTGSTSDFGARFDGEADAALMLVLCLWLAPTAGWWVLMIGLARYAFAAAGWALPWLRAQLPFRYWRKVVTAVASTVLVVATADLLPSTVTTALLVVAGLLIVESFGRDVGWLWRRRSALPTGGVRRA